MTATVVALSLADVNAMERERFVATVGPTFENAPWIAEGAWAARPFADTSSLHAALFDVVDRSAVDTRLAFLCGHPDLAGKEAQAGTMTSESVGEQASAGLDALTAAEVAQIQAFNRAYRERHGFPFIIAVRRHTKAQILAEMQRRLAADTPGELAEAMRQIAFITRGRIDALFHQEAVP